MKVSYITDSAKINNIDARSKEIIDKVSQKYVFRANDYYLGLINWEDPNDPIKQIIIPREDELNEWGSLDASNEKSYTVAKGCQHKYKDTALLLVNEVCGAYCRYCFRKRLFMNDNDEASLNVTDGINYIANHPEITNVLLTGGDPLIMSTKKIAEILSKLREIPHVNIIRIGSKMVAFNPWRILDDPALLETISKYSTAQKRIYIMNHFDHPRELTESAVEALHKLMDAGAICVNQCPMIKGVNDNGQVLTDLFRKLSFIGVPQYYIFQGRPTAGNEPYEVPIVEGYKHFEDALKNVSGLAKRVRFAMSHSTGKIEVIGVDENFIYMRYHRAYDRKNYGKVLVFHRDDKAYWFDQLIPINKEKEFKPLKRKIHEVKFN